MQTISAAGKNRLSGRSIPREGAWRISMHVHVNFKVWICTMCAVGGTAIR